MLYFVAAQYGGGEMEGHRSFRGVTNACKGVTRLTYSRKMSLEATR